MRARSAHQWRPRPIALGLAVALVGWCAAAAAAAPTIEVLGQAGGVGSAVARSGDTVLVALGPRVVAVDVADPSAPRALGASPPLGGFVGELDMAAGRGVAWLADGGDVVLLDMTDRATPAVLDTLSGTAVGAVLHGLVLAADGDTLFLSTGDGLAIHGLAGGRFERLGGLAGVRGRPATAGDVLYLGHELGGLAVVEVADPAQPAVVGHAPGPELASVRGDGAGRVYGLARDVVGSTVIGYDVRAPGAPVEIGRAAAGGAGRLAVGTGRLFATALADGSVTVLDTGGGAPAPAGTWVTFSPVDVAAAGEWALVSAMDGLRTVDARSAGAPAGAAWLSLGGGLARAVLVSNGIAWVAHAAGLVTFDVADPTRPRAVGAVERPGERGGIVADTNLGWRGLALRDDLMFVAAGHGGLVVVDAGDPGAPAVRSVLSAAALAGTAESVAVHGEHVLVGTPSGLVVVDARMPDQLVPVGQLAVAGGVAGIAPAGDGRHVLLAAGRAGVIAVDLERPTSPVARATIEEGGLAVADVAVAGSVAVAAAGTRLVVLDIGRPAAPRRLAALEVVTEPAVAVMLAGTVAWLAGGDEVVAVDVADPTAPRELARRVAEGNAVVDLAADGGMLAAVSGLDGLRTLRLEGADDPTGTATPQPTTGIHLPLLLLPAAGSAALRPACADHATARCREPSLAEP